MVHTSVCHVDSHQSTNLFHKLREERTASIGQQLRGYTVARNDVLNWQLCNSQCSLVSCGEHLRSFSSAVKYFEPCMYITLHTCIHVHVWSLRNLNGVNRGKPVKSESRFGSHKSRQCQSHACPLKLGDGLIKSLLSCSGRVSVFPSSHLSLFYRI